ncbi:MAG: DUF4974 domain-containing protein [Mangrovibacterium sp.]|nr:DUF4974 domain-containing protein [Mangrovibacterium sp.]
MRRVDYWLIWKSLHDSLTPEERKELDLWLHADRRHRDYYEKRKDRFQQGKGGSYHEVDSKKAWNRFIFLSGQRRTRFRKFNAIAASILLVMTLGYLSWNWVFGYRQQRVPAEDIFFDPGVKKATLVFGDGQKLELDAKKDTLIRKCNVVIKNSGSSLNYELMPARRLHSPKEFNRLIVPRGGEYYLDLSDGTKVWVNSETILRYPVVFDQDERCVELIGEAYFEVKADSLRPFIVVSGEHTVKVFGTAFNLKSYPDEPVITTSLVQGRVRVMAKGERPTVNELKPGDQSIYTKGTSCFKLQEVDTRQYTSWKDGRFYFRELPLEEIMKVLGRWYNVDFVFEDPLVKTLQFNGNLKRYDNIQPILSQLSKTNEITFYAYGKTIYVN